MVEKVVSFIDPASVSNPRLVIDAANWTARTSAAAVGELLENLGKQPSAGTIIPQPRAEPAAPRNRKVIVEKVLEEKADLGIAFDGDADRCFFVDDTGESCPATSSRRCSLELCSRTSPGADHLRHARSWAVRDVVEAAGGRAVVTGSATPPSSTGCARKTRFSRARSPGITSATTSRPTRGRADAADARAGLLKGTAVSEILERFRDRYFLTGELNTVVDDVALKLQELIALRHPRRGVASGWHLCHRRRLAHERKPLEYGAGAAVNASRSRRGLTWAKGGEVLAVIGGTLELGA